MAIERLPVHIDNVLWCILFHGGNYARRSKRILCVIALEKVIFSGIKDFQGRIDVFLVNSTEINDAVAVLKGCLDSSNDGHRPTREIRPKIRNQTVIVPCRSI